MAWREIVLAVVAGLGGAGGVVGGLLGFLARKNLQRDRERFRRQRDKENAAFQREIEEFRSRSAALLESQRTAGAKDVFVHRLQFEKEFGIYLNLWKSVRKAEGAANQHARTVTNKAVSHTDKQRVFDAYKRSLEEVEEVFLGHQPFYAPEVREVASDFRNKGFQLHLAQDCPVDQKAYFKTSEELQAKLRAVRDASQAVVEVIRNRIWR